MAQGFISSEEAAVFARSRDVLNVLNQLEQMSLKNHAEIAATLQGIETQVGRVLDGQQKLCSVGGGGGTISVVASAERMERQTSPTSTRQKNLQEEQIFSPMHNKAVLRRTLSSLGADGSRAGASRAVANDGDLPGTVREQSESEMHLFMPAKLLQPGPVQAEGESADDDESEAFSFKLEPNNFMKNADSDVSHLRSSRMAILHSGSMFSSAELRSGRMRNMSTNYYDMVPLQKVENVQIWQKAWRFVSTVLMSISRTLAWLRLVPLHPEAPLRVVIDGMCLVLLLLDSVMMPYMLAFEVSMKDVLVLSWVSCIVWQADLFLNFVTGYVTSDTVVMDVRKITRRYATSWFIPDAAVLSADWLGLFLYQFGDAKPGDATATAKLVRFLKIARFLRIFSMVRSGRVAAAETLLDRMARACGLSAYMKFISGLSRLVFFILWLNHLGGCIWWTFVTGAIIDSESGWSSEIAEKLGGLGNEKTLLTGDDTQTFQLYLEGLYWSVTAMFSGVSSRVPTNSLELIFSLFFVIFGILFGSTLISSVAAMLVDFHLVQREKWEKVSTLQQFLRQHEIPERLSQGIQAQIARRVNAEKPVAVRDVNALDMLSSDFRESLWRALYGPKLVSNNILGICDHIDDAFIHDLATYAVQWAAVESGQRLFSANEHMPHAFCLITGGLVYTRLEDLFTTMCRSTSLSRSGTNLSLPSERRDAEVDPGTWLCELALWCRWVTRGEAECVKPGELLSLKVQELASVMLFHPDVALVAQDYSTTLCNHIRRSKLYTSDLRKFMDISEDSIICALPLESRCAVSQPALQACYKAVRHDPRRVADIKSLEVEVGSGKCWLSYDSTAAQVVRVVQIAVLKLVRDDGCVCMRIGEWFPNEQRLEKRRPQLPGTKLCPGEMPKQALERLLATEFPATDLRITGGGDERIETVPSETYGVTTKYVTIEFPAVLLGDRDKMQLMGWVRQGRQDPSSGRSKFDEFLMPLCICEDGQGTKLSVYTWFTPARFQAVQDAKHRSGAKQHAAQLMTDWAVDDVDFSTSSWSRTMQDSV